MESGAPVERRGYSAAQVRAAEQPLLAAGEPLMRRAASALAAARQARPGLPAVSAAASSTPPTIATVRKKFDCLRARAAGSFSAQKASCI